MSDDEVSHLHFDWKFDRQDSKIILIVLILLIVLMIYIMIIVRMVLTIPSVCRAANKMTCFCRGLQANVNGSDVWGLFMRLVACCS